MREKDKKKAFSIFKGLKSNSLNISNIKRAYSLAIMLGRMSGDFKIILNMFNSYIKGEFKIPKKDIAIIIACISYVILPTDAIFDYIPFVGFVDDVFIVTYVFNKLKSLIDEYKESIGE